MIKFAPMLTAMSVLSVVSSSRQRKLQILQVLLCATALGVVLSLADRAMAGSCTATGAPPCTALPRASNYDQIQFLGAGANLPAPDQNLPTDQSEPAPPVPFDLKQSSSGVSVRTGLGALNDYNAKSLSRKIDSVKGSVPPNVTLPKTVPTPKPPLDIWTNVEAQGLSGETTTSVRAAIGADYTYSNRTTAGISAERAEGTATDTASQTQNEKVSAYVAFKAIPSLTVDTKTRWEKSVSGPATGLEGTEKSSVSLAPRVNHKFTLEGGKTLEPYVSVQHEIDMSGGLKGADGKAPLSTVNSAAAGVTFTKPESYSVTVSTDVDGVGAADAANIKGQLQLKLPLQ